MICLAMKLLQIIITVKQIVIILPLISFLFDNNTSKIIDSILFIENKNFLLQRF